MRQEALSHVPTDLDQCCDTRAAAALLGLKPSTLEAWRCAGRDGPRFLRLGRRVVYRRRDLLEYLARAACGPDSAADPTGTERRLAP